MHVVELTTQQRNAALDAAPVDFEFGFAGTARADTAAQAREIRTHADQIGLSIAQLRELDLELAFTAARMAREYVEDQHRAIDDRNGNYPFEILTLTRTQIVEYQHEFRIALFDQIGDLLRFAAPDQRRRIDVIAPLHDAIDDNRTGRLRECFEFYEFGFEWTLRVLGVDSDDNRSMSQRSPST